MPWYAMGLSVMATQASAITLVGTTGQAYVDGMRFIQIYFALPIAMVILCFTLVPLFYRARVFTAYEVSGAALRSAHPLPHEPSLPVWEGAVRSRGDLRAVGGPFGRLLARRDRHDPAYRRVRHDLHRDGRDARRDVGRDVANADHHARHSLLPRIGDLGTARRGEPRGGAAACRVNGPPGNAVVRPRPAPDLHRLDGAPGRALPDALLFRLRTRARSSVTSPAVRFETAAFR